jgi:hypothetical protein
VKFEPLRPRVDVFVAHPDGITVEFRTGCGQWYQGKADRGWLLVTKATAR